MMNTPMKYGPHGKYIEVWGCESASNPNKVYTVARTADNQWSCSCPVWTLNRSRPECKHIKHVQAVSRSNQRIIDIRVVEMPEKVRKALSQFSMLEV